MPKVAGEVVIHRAIDEVFDFVADERNEPSYNDHMVRVELLSGLPIGLGTRFRAELKRGRWVMPMTVEWTEYDRPRRLGSITRSTMMETEGALTFEGVPGGTKMPWSWDVRPRGFARALTPIVGVLGRRQEQRIWHSLRRLLEADNAATGTP